MLERSYSSLKFSCRHLLLASKIYFDRGIANGVHKVFMVLVSASGRWLMDTDGVHTHGAEGGGEWRNQTGAGIVPLTRT